MYAGPSRTNRAARFRPAGKGRVLVVQPSPERYVIGQEQAVPPLTSDTCAGLLENIVAWLQRPAG